MITKGVKQLVAEADAEIETVSLDAAKTLLEDDSVVVVDIRDVRELDREGMIPGAYYAPRGMLEFWVDPNSPYHKDVFASGKKFLLYCAGAQRSALAVRLPNLRRSAGPAGAGSESSPGSRPQGIAQECPGRGVC